MIIKTKKISKYSLFKLLLCGYSMIVIPFFIVCGISSLFGGQNVQVGGEPVTGVMGLVASLIMAPIFSTMLSILNWIPLAIGLWIFSKIKHINIELTEVTD